MLFLNMSMIVSHISFDEFG
uniref:Uncharacterized protein n=1 Tax=Rhizophora mucronata TaxID=61149 RepID=A0A2P2NXP7_RHIMU